jgi:hypothetical protein
MVVKIEMRHKNLLVEATGDIKRKLLSEAFG